MGGRILGLGVVSRIGALCLGVISVFFKLIACGFSREGGIRTFGGF